MQAGTAWPIVGARPAATAEHALALLEDIRQLAERAGEGEYEVDTVPWGTVKALITSTHEFVVKIQQQPPAEHLLNILARLDQTPPDVARDVSIIRNAVVMNTVQGAAETIVSAGSADSGPASPSTYYSFSDSALTSSSSNLTIIHARETFEQASDHATAAALCRQPSFDQPTWRRPVSGQPGGRSAPPSVVDDSDDPSSDITDISGVEVVGHIMISETAAAALRSRALGEIFIAAPRSHQHDAQADQSELEQVQGGDVLLTIATDDSIQQSQSGDGLSTMASAESAPEDTERVATEEENEDTKEPAPTWRVIMDSVRVRSMNMDEQDEILQRLSDANTRFVSRAEMVSVRWLSGPPPPHKNRTSVVLELTNPLAANTAIGRGLRWDGLICQCVKFHKGFRVYQCFRCWKYGHRATECPAPYQICGHCNDRHQTYECPDQSNMQCANCGKSHPSWSWQCIDRRQELQRTRPSQGNPTRLYPVPADSGPSSSTARS